MTSRADCELTVGRLTVRFTRQGDRWGHTVFVDDAPALVSVEGAPDEAWPASPPLQEIHEQDLPDGRKAIFGVGMAGRSHWSLSVTTEGDALLFEAACRAFGEQGPLGSVYERLLPEPVVAALLDTSLLDERIRVRMAPASAPQSAWSWRITAP